jgi:hypothetical protein
MAVAAAEAFPAIFREIDPTRPTGGDYLVLLNRAKVHQDLN